MADDTTTVTDPDAIAAANADTIRKQQQQDISGAPPKLDTLDPLESLNKLRQEKIDAAKAAAADPNAGDPPVVVPKGDDNQPPAGQNSPKPNVDPNAPDPNAPKPNVDPVPKPNVDPAPDLTVVDTIFKDTPGLPPNSSPKAAESFAAIKTRAAQEISARDSQITELTKQLSEATEKLKNPVPEDVQKELAELRNFRTQMDIEADPGFKSYDAKAEMAREFIYAQLAKVPVITAKVIEEIKGFGGPDKVNMDTILDSIKDGTVRRLVENRLAEIETLNFEKDQAIKKAKANVEQYVADRTKAFEQTATAHVTQTKAAYDNIIKSLDWMKPMQPPANADENARKLAEAHNKFLSESQKEVELALRDDSPEMRATLLVGMLNFFRYKGLFEAATEKIKAMTKEVADTKATLERLKGASTSRLRDSGAPPSGGTPKAPQPNIFNESATDALNRLRQAKLQAAQQ